MVGLYLYDLLINKSIAQSTVDLIKTFTTTIIWLVGIYVGGTVAALAVDKPHVTEIRAPVAREGG
jgi:hypothetical protein